MLVALLLAVCSLFLPQQVTPDFSIVAELLRITGNEEIKLKVEVKNLSDDTVTVLKYRRQDYKRKKIRALGNYVIEIQRSVNGQYRLFELTADIGPVFENQEHIVLKKGDSITDTLYIEGLSFSGKKERGFPPGQYRLKVCFNPDMSHDSETNSSGWVEFRIE